MFYSVQNTKFFFSLGVALLLFVSACSTPRPLLQRGPSFSNIASSRSGADAFGYTSADIEALKQRIQAKNARQHYPVALSIQTGLLTGEAKPVVSAVFEQGFRTLGEALPMSLWEQDYAISGTSQFDLLQVNLPDLIQDTKRYRLAFDVTQASELAISRRGVQLKKVTLQASEKVVLDKLILDSATPLEIEVRAQQAGRLHIALYEEEDAGHIFRQEMQALKPARPEDQLLDLSNIAALSRLSSAGEVPLVEGITKTGILVNGTDRLDFQSGVLILHTDSSETLQAFQTRYGASILEQQGNRYLMKLDLSQAQLNELPNLVRQYNQGIAENIEESAFASLAGMQTFAILLDSTQQTPHWQPFTVELNGIPETQQTTPSPSPTPVPTPTPTPVPTPTPTPSGLEDWNFNDINLGYSWWLVDSKIQQESGEKAWDYSQGTGVVVAYLDRGFKLDHPEVTRRLLIGSQNGQDYKNDQSRLGTANNKPHPEHGHKSLMTLGAEKNNQIWSAGSAPNVQMVPHDTITFWDFETAVYNSMGVVDIIGISSSLKDYTWLTYINLFAFSGTFGYLWHVNGNGYMEAIERAYDYSDITFVVSAGNGDGTNGESYRGYLPANSPYVISVGAVQPSTSSRNIQSTRWPVASKESLNISNFSNFGDNLIWGPGKYIKISDRLDPKQVVDYSGTSSAAPFVAGIVALMKSRNPDLKPSCIKEILKDTSALGVVVDPPLKNPNYPNSQTVNYVNALEAVKMATQKTANCGDKTASPKLVQQYMGLVQGSGSNKRLLLPKSILPNAAAGEKEKKLIQSVSDEFWSQRLVPGRFVSLQGWSDIVAGHLQISSEEMEVSEGENLCSIPSCYNHVSLRPSITKVQVAGSASSSKDFEMTLFGQNLFPDLRASQGRKFQIELHPVGGGAPITLRYNLQADVPASNIWNVNHVIDVSQKGAFLRFEIPANSVPSGDYHVVFESALAGRTGTSASGFHVSSNQGGSGPVVSLRAFNPPVEEIPTGHYVYDQVGSQWIKENARLPVETNDFAGLYFTQPIRQLTVKVGPVELPVVSVLRDLAVLGIPEDLPAGVHELTLEVDGQTLTLKDALEKITPAVQPTPEPSTPASASPEVYEHLRVFNVEGNDEARVYINGQLALTAHAGDEAYLNLGTETNHVLRTDRPNEIIFEYENRGGGYTLGYSLESASHLRFYHEQGKAGVQNVVNRDGSEDQRQGVVFRERLLTHRTAAHPVGSGALWVKVFNMDQGDSIVLSTYNETEDIQWNTDRSANPGKNGEWVKQLPWPVPLYCEYYDLIAPSNSCWADYSLELRGLTNSAGSASYGMEVYRGVHRVFHQVYGQVDGWGMNDNATTPGNISLGYENAARFTSHGHHPVFNN